jgi:hypothetical protein
MDKWGSANAHQTQLKMGTVTIKKLGSMITPLDASVYICMMTSYHSKYSSVECTLRICGDMRSCFKSATPRIDVCGDMSNCYYYDYYYYNYHYYYNNNYYYYYYFY